MSHKIGNPPVCKDLIDSVWTHSVLWHMRPNIRPTLSAQNNSSAPDFEPLAILFDSALSLRGDLVAD